MTEARRRAYLEAMGIDVWISRQRAAAELGADSRLGVGAGPGSTLLICERAEDIESPLAGDVARTVEALVGEAPVWAWLDPGPEAEALALEQLVASRLITSVLVFGAAVERRLGGGRLPGVLGSASVSTAPDFDQLAVRGSARRDLWLNLMNAGRPGRPRRDG